MTTVTETYSPEETFLLGKSLGLTASSGDILCLNGELGAGKTVFVKGFGEGLSVKEPISSPTFTIVKEYTSGRLPLYHFDVYRIGDPDEMDEIGYEDYFYGDGVTLIEWSGLIAELIPGNATRVLIEKDPEKGDDYRKITITERKEA